MDSAERYRISRNVTLVGAGVNLLLAVVKMIVGVIGMSHALVADGVHSLSDLLSDAMVLLAAKWGSAEADDNHPYGHRRIETFATFSLGIFLVAVGVGIALFAVSNMVHGVLQKPDQWALWAAVFSIAANEGLFQYTLHHAKRIKSDLLKANAWHSRSDALASIIVVVGILGSMLGWVYCDAVAAVLVAALIIKMGFSLSWKAVAELTDVGLPAELLADIEKEILAHTQVLSNHQLRTRSMAERVFLDVHIEIPPYVSASEGHFIAEQVRIGLMKKFKEVTDVTVHVDIENHPETLPDKMLLSRSELLARYQPIWAEHLPAEWIQGVVLHYIKGKIEVELMLSQQAIDQNPQVSYWTSVLQPSVEGDQDIRSLKVTFG